MMNHSDPLKRMYVEFFLQTRHFLQRFLVFFGQVVEMLLRSVAHLAQVLALFFFV